MLSLKQVARSDSSMMKVGLISDTHVPTRAMKIPLRVFKVFQNVDHIIHAGDLVELEVIYELERLAPVLAVHGNMDRVNIREKLPKMNELELYDWRIGIIHDPGALLGLGNMRKIIRENNYDVLVYGHTHRSSIRWDDSRLFINPGSPTNPLPPFITNPTVATLKLTRERIQPEIISLKK